MNRPWLAVGSLVTVAVLGFATFNIVSLLAYQEITETRRFAADGVASLDLDTENGTVEVVGGDVEEIVVESHVTHGFGRATNRAEVRNGTLVVLGDCSTGIAVWCSVDYRLVVPKDLVVSVHDDNGGATLRDLDGDVTVATSNGRIDVTGLGGDLDARTSNGRILGRGLRGEVVAHTSNGRIELAFSEAPPSVRAETSNGSIEVVVPEDATSYRVDVDTSNGSTRTLVSTDPASDQVITAHTSNGSVTVGYPTD